MIIRNSLHHNSFNIFFFFLSLSSPCYERPQHAPIEDSPGNNDPFKYPKVYFVTENKYYVNKRN